MRGRLLDGACLNYHEREFSCFTSIPTAVRTAMRLTRSQTSRTPVADSLFFILTRHARERCISKRTVLGAVVCDNRVAEQGPCRWLLSPPCRPREARCEAPAGGAVVPVMHILCAHQLRRGHEGGSNKPCITHRHFPPLLSTFVHIPSFLLPPTITGGSVPAAADR